ncbi:hypothetical protein P872_11210 [Rhodonellum psychrophilum GCM71 = DSM 17998]|uniref:histidine kinase n=2 Tax=Rhodonellum TaxID=336827 RepID=U5BYB7_9BACT|nr:MULTISPECIES: PAS domain S-box protein [Rhodonellum]ERM80877.1 hypothetical protein P872_11210 [Rhodonellum psychrophilum GCM71 = DSM 17998]SDZ08487.1 PAS domain S-box-containing protein [Rhodonellum ikkaensis]
MKKPDAAFNESKRITNVDTYHNLDAADQQDFDFLTAMAVQICGTKISLISMVTADKPWILSHHGWSIQETSNAFSFSVQALKNPNEVFVVEDARKDERFQDNPGVARDSQVIFYASVPMVNKNGIALGSFCLVDHEPKTLTEEQLKLLQNLSRQALNLLEFRKKRIEYESVNKKSEQNLILLEETQKTNKIGAWELDITTEKTYWTEEVYAIHDVPMDFDHNKVNAIEFYHPNDKALIFDAITNAIENNQRFDVTCRLITAKGNLKWVRSTGRKSGEKLIGSFQDISEFKKNELKFQGIFNSSVSFIGFLNPDGILLEVNETALNMAGLKTNDVLGKYFWDCYWWQISEQTKAELKTNFQKALAGQVVMYEVAIWSVNQTPITFLFSLKPLFDDLGNVIYVIPEGWPIQEIVDTRWRNKSVIEGTNVGTWEWNVQTGETVFNKRWAEIIGYSLEELEPISIDTWMKFAHPDDLIESSRKLNLCFDKKAEFYEMEARMRHKDGRWIWVFDRGKVFEWMEDGKPLKMYGTHQDITLRKEKELETKYQKNILDALYELSPIGISLNDYETGKYLNVNQKLLEPSGYTKEEFLSLSYWDVTPKEYEAKEQTALLQMENSGQYEPFEKEYIRKNGTRYPVLLRGMLIEDLYGKKLIWSFIQDISKEKETERNLHEAINRLHAILKASTQVSIIATDINGTITLFNSGSERMLGYKSDELVGKHTLQILHPKEEIEGQELWADDGEKATGFQSLVHKARQGISTTKEWSYKRKDGSIFPVLHSVTAIRQDEKIIGYLGVAADITELKTAESKIKSLLAEKLEQNNRLQNFAFIVSHNLRSHSSGISGLLDLLNDESPELFQNEMMQLLVRGGDNLKQTVEDLTEVVKVNLNNSEKKSFIGLRNVIDKNLESLSAQIKDSETTVENLVEKSITVIGIAAYLNSIVLNLITNAIKYCSKERRSHLKIYTQIENKYVILNFEDNGLGIDLNKHGDKLFGMYKTFHKHHDSRGIGLFITKNQIESMGGKIEVESKVNEGTTFRIYLPSE